MVRNGVEVVLRYGRDCGVENCRKRNCGVEVVLRQGEIVELKIVVGVGGSGGGGGRRG